jgi:hypothetical protein
MTARPQLDDRDPTEPATWTPVSHTWARRAALDAAASAVRAAKDARKKPAEETT